MSGLSTLDECEVLWDKIQDRRAATEAYRLKPPTVELYDGGYTLRGEVYGELSLEFEFIENETSPATLRLPLDHYLAKWVMDHRGRTKRNVHTVIEKQGARWSGCMDHYSVVKEKGGVAYLEIVFMSDFEQVKHIRVWCNPFLPSILQFPKAWIIFGPVKWCILTTLFVNLLRLETSLWTLPDDPTDLTEWMGLSFIPSTWRNIVKPAPFLLDNSPISMVFSRFGTFYDAVKQLLEDHQLTLTCRRYLKDRDPHPFEDLKGEFDIPLVEDLASLIPLRHGCLVWDIEDNSDWGTEVAFGGSWLTGFVRAVAGVSSTGQVEGVEVYTGDVTSPADYFNPLYLGTAPKYPWIVFEEGPLTGILSSEFSYYECTDTSFIAGGQSMPGINEAISALINIGGDILTSFINTAIASVASRYNLAIDLPPLGGLIDAVAQPLYTDVFGAFTEVPTTRALELSLPISGLEDIKSGVGDFHYFENMDGASMKAFTVSAFAAIAAAIHATRTRTAHTIKVSDAAPYIFGDKGHGHCWIGSRVGTSVLGYPVEHQLFAERIKKLKYKVDKDGPSGWDVEIGYREPRSPALYVLEELKKFTGALGTAGIL